MPSKSSPAAVMLLSALVVASALAATSSLANEAASPWADSPKSAVRLIAGGKNADGSYRVGVEIRLAPGFKTYWRAPGDSGIPPTFDWSGSQNVGGVSVRWPTPKRYLDDQVVTIGYKGEVIYPVSVRAAEGGKPVVVNLKLDYAVCDTICIPASGAVSLLLPDVAITEHTQRLQTFRDRIPLSAPPGRADGRLALNAATGSFDLGRQVIDLAVGVPAGAALHDAFLEGPDGWVFGQPQRIEQKDNQVTLRIPVDERPRNVTGMVPFIVTLSGSTGGLEVRFDLDIAAPKP